MLHFVSLRWFGRLILESRKICFKMVGFVTEVQNHDENLEETACIQKITLKATQFVWF